MLIKVSVAAAAVSVAAMALPAVASADASDDYPIPNRILKTTCTVDQYMAAVRDVEPVYYERYMIDYNNRPPDVEQGARDRIYWFFSLDYAGRRQYSEDTATNVYYEQMATRWGNWAKLFFNNKGVAAHGTDVCASYPPSDPSVWNWGDDSASPDFERCGHAVLECGSAALRSAVSLAVGVSAGAERSDRYVQWHKGPAERLPFEDDALDAVVTTSAVHFFDQPAALRELHRVLAPSGVAAVATLSPRQPLPLHRLSANRLNPAHNPSPAEMRALFEGAGFRVSDQHRARRPAWTQVLSDLITVGIKPE